VKPSIRGTSGKAGVRRCYAYSDLVVMRSIKCLVDEGVSLQKIRRAFELLKKHGLEDELGRGLKAHGEMLLVGDPHNGVVMDTLRQGQLVFFEVVEHVADEVPASVLDFAKDRETLHRAIRSAERELLPRRRGAR
jgi:DNA-binding transcriptional MerR regulator